MKLIIQKPLWTAFLLFAAQATVAYATSFDQEIEKLTRTDSNDPKTTLSLLRENFRKDTSEESASRFAAATYFVGLRIEKDEEKKKALFREGLEATDQVLKFNPNSVSCLFWNAINTALYGQTVGPFRTYALLPKIRERLIEVTQRNPEYAYGGAFRLLGLIEQKLPGILGGSNRRAQDYFEKAITAAPEEPMNYLFMAKLLKEDLGKAAEAKKVAEKGLQIRSIPSYRIESFEALNELKSFR